MHPNSSANLSSRVRPGLPEIALWFLLILAAALLINLITLPLGRDQAVFSVIGGAMLEGQAPYSDVWDIKPPGIYFVYALAHAVFGGGEIAPRLLEVFTMLLMALGCYKLSVCTGDTRAAALAFLLALFGMVKFGFWHTAQPETFAAVLLIWAVIATQNRWYVTVGALYFCAALLKPSFGGGIVPSMIYAIMMIPRDRRNVYNVINPLARMAVGGAAVTVLCLGYLWISGGLAAFVWTMFSFVPNYVGDVASEETKSIFWQFAKASWHMAMIWPALVIGCGITLLFSFQKPELLGTSLLLVGAAFFPLVGVALQGKFFYYHFMATVGPLGLIAGWGYWMALTSDRLNAFVRVALLGVLLSALFLPESSLRFMKLSAERIQVAFLPEPERTQRKSEFFTWRSFDRASMIEASEWIKANTPEDSSIYVWGFDPNLYLLADRPSVTRFISNFTQRVSWSSEETRRELMETLQSNPPAAIVVSKFDIMEAVTGNMMSSGDLLETDFPALRDFVQNRYVLVENFGNFDVYDLIDKSS